MAGSFSDAAIDLKVGNGTGSVGTYNLGGTASLVMPTEYIGINGSGTFAQTGGTNNVGTILHIGAGISGESGPGVYQLSGGTLTVGSVDSSGIVVVGETSNGTLVQTGGALKLSGPGDNLYVGLYPGSTGTYQLKGGTLNAAWTLVGAYGNGTFTQSGGTHTTALLQLGYFGTGSSTYTLNSNDGAATLNAGNAFIGVNHSATFTQESGTTHTVNGTLDISATGAYDLYSGTLVASTLSVAAGGLFKQAGGSVDTLLTNDGTFAYSGGSFLGGLVNHTGGTVSLDAVLVAGGTVINDGSINVGLGAGLGGAVLTNNGTLSLAGGQLTGGKIENFGSVAGWGTFAGASSLTNYGQITQVGGNLILSNIGNTLNLNTVTLASGRQLQVQGGSLTNAGSLVMNGGLVSGSGSLVNSIGGTLSGGGVITAGFANRGNLAPGAATLNLTSAWTNSGLVQLTGATSVVTGAAITNTGTIQGLGVVGSAVTNTGTIEALGGTLRVGGPLSNAAGGTLVASTGNKLLAQGGLTTNAGLISLTGGTFDNGGKALSNGGQITGYGTLATGGLTNAGALTLATGVSTVNGDLNNAAAGKVAVAYGSAIFTGAVVNNGNFKTTSANVVFAGGFTNNGSYVSDPSVQSFGDLSIGSTGTLAGGAGDVFKVSGSFVNGSTQALAWDTHAASLVLTGVGSQTLVLAGADKGASFAGYSDNYSWGSVEFGSGLSLSVGSDASRALYAGLVVLDGGLGQLASVNSAANIYYDGNATGNAWLQAKNYAFGSGGGALVAVVPEPASAGLALLGLLAVGGLVRRGARRGGRPAQGQFLQA
jgi:hypothetical protein